jgi:1-acyl-sn-glycerol-3-phosphate acyltransferase
VVTVVPPKPVRRLVLAPAVPLLTLLILTAVPLAALVAAFVSPWLPGRWRPLRLLWFVIVFAVVESVTIVTLFGLWVASGFGRRIRDERWQAAHYAVMRGYLGVIVRSAARSFDLEFDVDAAEARAVEVPEGPTAGEVAAVAVAVGQPPPETPRGVSDADRRSPLLVFSRHAGPGDSFLLIHALLQLRLRPRIVLLATLQWAPALDISLNRVPSYFVSHTAPPGTARTAIAELAGGLGPGDALVLFPEGANYTPERRVRSITRLEELGDHDAAERARQMRYVLTPRRGGALAALQAAPTADVVFVAHTGLEELSTIVDLWRGLPMDSHIEAKAWRVPSFEAPRHPEEAAGWLHGWWRRIDAWILERYGEEAVPDAVIDAVSDEDG